MGRLIWHNGSLTKYVQLRIAHAPGMPLRNILMSYLCENQHQISQAKYLPFMTWTGVQALPLQTVIESWWHHQMETFPALLATGKLAAQSQWLGALILSLICARTHGWVKNRDAGDLRRHRTHYYVTVMAISYISLTVDLCWDLAIIMYNTASVRLITSYLIHVFKIVPLHVWNYKGQNSYRDCTIPAARCTILVAWQRAKMFLFCLFPSAK